MDLDSSKKKDLFEQSRVDKRNSRLEAEKVFFFIFSVFLGHLQIFYFKCWQLRNFANVDNNATLAYFLCYFYFYFYFIFIFISISKVPLMDPGKPMPDKQGKQLAYFLHFFFNFFLFPGAADGSRKIYARERRQAARQRGSTRRNKGAEGLKLLVYEALSY